MKGRISICGRWRAGRATLGMLSMASNQEGESPSPSLIEAKGSETQGRGREAGSESSVEQTCGPTNRNRIRGTKGGRAGQGLRSPHRSKPGSVDAVVVQGKWGDLSQETRRRLRALIWRQWKRGPTRFDELVKRGATREEAARLAGSSLGPWRISRTPLLSRIFPNRWFAAHGLPSFLTRA